MTTGMTTGGHAATAITAIGTPISWGVTGPGAASQPRVIREVPMPKVDTFAHAAKIVAVSLPPLVMALLGLAALSRDAGKARRTAGQRPAPSAAAAGPASR